MSDLSDDKKCPLCGEPNGCMAGSELPCWCNEVKVPAELIERVPEALKRKACICLKCIRAYQAASRE